MDERRLGVEGVERCVSLGNDRRYLLKSTSSRYEKGLQGNDFELVDYSI